MGAKVVESIGAVPMPTPDSEMFNMYSKGLVDGIVGDWGAMKVSNSFRYTVSVRSHWRCRLFWPPVPGCEFVKAVDLVIRDVGQQPC